MLHTSFRCDEDQDNEQQPTQEPPYMHMHLPSVCRHGLLLAALVPCVLPPACQAADDATSESLPFIFNGKDLTGWKVPPEPYWTVDSGTIIGQSDADKKMSMLYTEKSYGDVVFETEVRFRGEIDSGIVVRKPELQVQIGVSRSLQRDMTCSFYTNKYPEEAQAKRAAELFKLNDWNRIRVEAKGNTFTVWLNGEKVARYTSDGYSDPAPIGLQIHSGVLMKVEFRSLRALPL